MVASCWGPVAVIVPTSPPRLPAIVAPPTEASESTPTAVSAQVIAPCNAALTDVPLQHDAVPPARPPTNRATIASTALTMLEVVPAPEPSTPSAIEPNATNSSWRTT